ncbi:MAG TPA: PAS domain S-box protein, partial [Gemmataceae bacterium]|nr:PAS domain S-box protein [Gemmataceae bacterium]
MLVLSRMSQEAVAPSAGGKAKILLVDDRPANLLALRAVLEELGHALVEARSGEEVLSLVLQDDFAAILLDIRMPGLNGFELARLLRSRKRSRHTPIIFLTAYDSDDFPPAQAYSLGAVDYLVTPLVPVALRAKVAVFVDLFEKTEQVKRQAEELREAERRDFERRLAEEAVRESQARLTLAAIVESSEDAIIGKAMDGTITSWNKGAEHLYGYAAEEVKGKPFSLLNPSDSPDELPSIMERLQRGDHIQPYETVRVRKDGQRLDVSVTISPIRDATGRTVGASSIARDITERIRRERRLAAEHAVGQILAASSTLCDAAPGILQAVCDSLGWDVGTVWAVDRGANVLRCVKAWHRPGMEATSFE